VLQIGKGISRSVAQVEDGVAGNMAVQRASLDEIRGFYAKLMAAASGSHDPRLERIFELVPREAFLPPGPWKIMVGETYVDTPSADPVYLYQNTLVALDAGKGINNGVPSLHAAWIGAASPARRDRHPCWGRHRLLHGNPVDAGACWRPGSRL
jgi:hypothetical protein